MKRIFYFLKNYIIDIITAFFGFVGIIFTLLYAPTSNNVQQIISLTVVVLTLLTIIYLRAREKKFVFSALTWRKDKEAWMGYGKFELARVQKAYEITDADPGYIHSEVLTWSNYKYVFEFKIAKSCLGVLVRATDLSNCILLQLTSNGINPHIIINGAQQRWEAKDANLIFQKPLSIDTWHKCEIFCDKSTITIRLFSGYNKIFDRVWEVPRGSLILAYDHSSEHPISHMPFPFTLEYGAAGFRNFGNEKAFIKNVLIEKL